MVRAPRGRSGIFTADMEGMYERAREILDRRTAIAMLATAKPGGRPEVCLLIAPQLVGDDQVAGGEEEGVSGDAFKNLRQNGSASILVLDPIMDPRARDGVRLEVEFLGAEADGDGLSHMSRWLESFAPGRKVVRRLLFKIQSIHGFRPPQDGPVLLS